MLLLLIASLAPACVCFILLRISGVGEENEKKLSTLKYKIAFPLSASVILWLVWCGIREYWPPINIHDHWLSTLIALGSMVLAMVAGFQAFSSPINARLIVGSLCLFI